MPLSQLKTPHGGPERAPVDSASPCTAVPDDRARDVAQSAEQMHADRIALAIEHSGTGVWDRDVVRGEMHYSPGWKAILGYDASELSNRIDDSYDRLHPDDRAAVHAAIQAHFEQGTESYCVEHRIRCKNGDYKWIASRGRVVSRAADGTPLRMVGTTTDITALRQMSERLQQSVDLITSLTNEVPGLVYQCRMLADGSMSFPYASAGIVDIYELVPADVAHDGAAIEARIHPDDRAAYRTSLEQSATVLAPWHLEFRVILPRQGLRWRHATARPSPTADGAVIWHGLITDVTERKHNEIELQEFATIDFLTQLPNRRHFMAKMEKELVLVQRNAISSTAVLMCDLDHFKAVNDRYGHAVGDRVLQNFAAILRDQMRKHDTVGRVGGEEFAVVLPGANLEEATGFAQRLQSQMVRAQLVDCIDAFAITVSVGIALLRATDASADSALARSDVALYRAKDGGRNRIEVLSD